MNSKLLNVDEMKIEIGDIVKIIDSDFVRSNGENIGIIVKGIWFFNSHPESYGGIAKMFLYELKLRQSQVSVLLPIESLSVLGV